MTKADLAAWRDMLVKVRDRVAALAAKKKTLAEIEATKPTARHARGDDLQVSAAAEGVRRETQEVASRPCPRAAEASRFPRTRRGATSMNIPPRTVLRRAAGLALVALATGCATSVATSPQSDAALTAHSQAIVQLRRGGCDDGHCRVYGLAVYTNGDVLYDGAVHVAVIGERKSHLPDGALATIVGALEKFDFLDTPEHCCDCPDTPADRRAAKLVIDYRPGGVEKEILVDERCLDVPQPVRDLEGQISVAAGIGAWITPTPTQTP